MEIEVAGDSEYGTADQRLVPLLPPGDTVSAHTDDAHVEVVQGYDLDALSGPILDALAAGKDLRAIPGYLGSGSDKHAFLVDVLQGNAVLKVLKGPDPSYDVDPTEDYMDRKFVASTEPLKRGQGVQNFEQLLSTDRQKGLLLTSYMPGKKVADMSPMELMGIKDTHLRDLRTSLQEFRDRGIHPHNCGGIFFDPESGFGFADYDLDGDKSVTNRGSIATLEDFLYYALSDLNKLYRLAALEADGMPVPDHLYRTTGMRAMVRAMICRRAAKLADQ